MPSDNTAAGLVQPWVDGTSGRGRRIERRLAAVLGIDVVGYSLLMASNDEDTHRRIGQALGRVSRAVRRAGGHVFSFSGDGLMAALPSSIVALRCANRIQADQRRNNAGVEEDRRIVFRIGVNVGEVVVQDGRVGGDAVNVAARLEQLCDPGGVCVAAAVVEQVGRMQGVAFASMGEHRLKNMRVPVSAYRVEPAGEAGPRAGVARGRVAAPDSRPSVAVLPLRDLGSFGVGPASGGAESGDGYFADVVVEDIVVSLTGLRELVVISSSSAMAFAGGEVDLREVGRALGVRYVVSGSVRRSSVRVRVSVMLTEAETGTTVWADTIDAPAGDLFRIQDDIVRRIVAGVAPHIEEVELRRALRRHPANMTAYDLTLQAVHAMHQPDPALFAGARDLLGRAMEADPRFAVPVAWAVWWHVRWVGQGRSDCPDADAARAAALAELAITLDPHLALGLAMQGHVLSFLFHDHDSALMYFERAVAVGPNHSLAAILYARTLACVGRGAEAVRMAEHGLRLSPIDRRVYLYHNILAWCHYAHGSNDDAVKWGRICANEAPKFTANLRVFMASLEATGCIDEARAAALRMLQLEPDFTMSRYEHMRQPFCDGPIKSRYLAHLRAAGLPP